MNRRDLNVFLGLEIFAVVWAGLMFSQLESKVVAGALAGTYFVISGIFMLWRANRWSGKWASATWYLLFLHVFVISLPMLIARFLQSEAQFSDVRIMGVSGPVFHNISSYVFGTLMAATVLDWLRSKKGRETQPFA